MIICETPIGAIGGHNLATVLNRALDIAVSQMLDHDLQSLSQSPLPIDMTSIASPISRSILLYCCVCVSCHVIAGKGLMNELATQKVLNDIISLTKCVCVCVCVFTYKLCPISPVTNANLGHYLWQKMVCMNTRMFSLWELASREILQHR